ncbi:MFS transporter [Nocardia terpenica]|nr:MFS transporter [Nocardia terpenica]MBF6108821.1 MFS transporter [Nocardia terpenica]MBF6116227.1 MFS transporter [Nocardia terpenica]MBF6123228.1 MFS transporter [Nocardia terpenica]MBF6153090.1 MFS transporter [Nocardia terpenica]
MNTGAVGLSTVATVFVAEQAGAGASGLSNAALVSGTAAGALGTSALMAGYGRRVGLLVVYCVAGVGGVVAVAGVLRSSLPVLLIGVLVFGGGYGATQLSRYVAAAVLPEHRRGFGVSLIVWAGTVGAVAGPALIAPASAVATGVRLPGLSGPVAVSALLAVATVAVTAALPRAVGRIEGERPERSSLRGRVVLVPLVAMVAAQAVMVSVMTMTPVQMRHLGSGLEVVGWVISAHMAGMYALAPVSGRIADRWGGRVAMTAGLAVQLVAAVTVVAAPSSYRLWMPIGLFLVGYGWNLVFVGGSGTLSRDLPPGERARLQGGVDAVVWASSALASLAAGQLFAAGGFRLVAVVGAAIAGVVPLAVVRRRAGG